MKVFDEDGNPLDLAAGGGFAPKVAMYFQPSVIEVPATTDGYHEFDFTSHNRMTYPDPENVSEGLSFHPNGIGLDDPAGIYFVFATFVLTDSPQFDISVSVTPDWYELGSSGLRIDSSEGPGARQLTFMTGFDPEADPFVLRMEFQMSGETDPFNLQFHQLAVVKMV
jgi:hypothetical protein